jgi:hypothetical protein
MPATRVDPLSQRLLVQVLRRTIDLYLYQPHDRTAERRVVDIVNRNPTSARSSHVQHNLGAHRRAALVAILERAQVTRRD